MPINIGSTAKLWNKLLKRNAEYDIVSSGCTRLLTSVTCSVVVMRQSHDACCEGVWHKDIQFVMVDSWDICTTWNAHKEDGFMAITFFNSWIWITCIPLMVNICDKKRHLMLYILPYFQDTLIPIMTPVTFDESHRNKCKSITNFLIPGTRKKSLGRHGLNVWRLMSMSVA